jgi:hypothetical protein
MLPATVESAFVLSEFGVRQGIDYAPIPDDAVASLARYALQSVAFQEQVDIALPLTLWPDLRSYGRP